MHAANSKVENSAHGSSCKLKFVHGTFYQQIWVNIHKTCKHYMIIIWEGVPYCESDENYLCYPYLVMAPPIMLIKSFLNTPKPCQLFCPSFPQLLVKARREWKESGKHSQTRLGQFNVTKPNTNCHMSICKKVEGCMYKRQMFVLFICILGLQAWGILSWHVLALCKRTQLLRW